MSSTIAVLIPERASIFKLKVKNGARVQRGSVLCLYRSEKRPEFTEKLRSTKDGIVKSVSVSNGQQVEADTCVMSIEQETCLHPIVVKMICADCGVDLKPQFMDSEVKGISASNANLASAKVSMIHNVPELMVSSDIAEDVATKDVTNLLESRKLVLIVDLDQTLIHTTNDDVPSNLKDVHHFQLQQGGAWYHTKLRPGAKEFLEEISKYFELQIITFGVRLYAHIIASILDPDEKLFHHRIMARDEIHLFGNDKTANISSLFPVGDEMVCVIDDRDDVWRYMENVIKVPAYKFFPSTGDINDPLRAQRNQKSSSEAVQLEAKEAQDPKSEDKSQNSGANENSESSVVTSTVQNEGANGNLVLDKSATKEKIVAALNGATNGNDSNNEDSITESWSSEVSTRTAKRVRFSLPTENEEDEKSELYGDKDKINEKEINCETSQDVQNCDLKVESLNQLQEKSDCNEKGEIENEIMKVEVETESDDLISSTISEKININDVKIEIDKEVVNNDRVILDKIKSKEQDNLNEINNINIEPDLSQENSSSSDAIIQIPTPGKDSEIAIDIKPEILETSVQTSAKTKSYKLGKMGRIPKKSGRKAKAKDALKSSTSDASSSDSKTAADSKGQKKRKRKMLFGDLEICMGCEEGVPHACSISSMTDREIVEADADLTSEKKTGNLVLDKSATKEKIVAALNGATNGNDSNNEDSITESWSSEVSTRTAKRVRFSLPTENEEDEKSELYGDKDKINEKEINCETSQDVQNCDLKVESLNQLQEKSDCNEKGEIENEIMKVEVETESDDLISSTISEKININDVKIEIDKEVVNNDRVILDKIKSKEQDNLNEINNINIEPDLSQENSSSSDAIIQIPTPGKDSEIAIDIKPEILETSVQTSAKTKSYKLGKMGRIPKKSGRKAKAKDALKSSTSDASSSDSKTAADSKGQKKRKRKMLFGDLEICMGCEEGVPHACSISSMTDREIVEADADLTSEKKTLNKGVELLKTQPVKSARRSNANCDSQSNTSNVGTSPSNMSWEDNDNFLPFLKDILLKVHHKFYEQYDKNKQSVSDGESPQIPNVKDVINDTKTEALSDCVLVFSAVVPTNFPIANSREYLEAKSLGATVMESMDTKLCTHVVAARQGTHKVHQARKTGKRIKIVNPDWLWSCSQKWIQVDEQEFSLESFDHTKTLKTSWYPSPRNNFKHETDKQSVDVPKSSQEPKFDTNKNEKVNDPEVDDVSIDMCNTVADNHSNLATKISEKQNEEEKENDEKDQNESMGSNMSSENDDDQASTDKGDDYELNENSNEFDISDESDSYSENSNGADENLEDEIALIESALLAKINNVDTEQTV